jgi:hypothetical protein
MKHITSKVKQKKHKVAIVDGITINYRLNTIVFSKALFINNGLDSRIHGYCFSIPESFEQHAGEIIVSFKDIENSDYRINRRLRVRNKYVCDRIVNEHTKDKTVTYSVECVDKNTFLLRPIEIKNPIIRKK